MASSPAVTSHGNTRIRLLRIGPQAYHEKPARV
jgi:hypothetical protein